MDLAKNDLLNYLRERARKDNGGDPNAALTPYIKRFWLQPILLEELKALDKEEYARSCKQLEKQRVFNAFLEVELNEITERFREKRIKVIHLKGLFLALGLYRPLEARLFNDIDILVAASDLEAALDLVGGLGYRPDAEADYLSDKAAFLERWWDIGHVKRCSWNDKELTVRLELHFTLFQPDMVGTGFKVDEIFDRAVEVAFGRYNVWTLHLYDELLYLLMHFNKHFTEHFNRLVFLHFSNRNHLTEEHARKLTQEYRGKADGWLSRTYEITRLIDKYRASLDWNAIADRAEQWNVAVPVAVTLQIVSSIYPGRIPQELIDRLGRHKPNERTSFGFRKHVWKEMLRSSPDYLVFGDNYDELASSIVKVSADGPELECPFTPQGGRPVASHINTFVIDETSGRISTRLGTHVQAGVRPSSRLDCSGRGRTWWDALHLYVEVRVFDDMIVFHNTKSVDAGLPWHERDGVEIMLFSTDSAPVWQHYAIAPVHTRDELSVSVTTAAEGICLSPGLYKYEVRTYGDGYSLTIGLPWDLLGIKPHVGLEVGFDVAINDCDGEPEGRKTRLAYTTGRTSFQDVTAYGKIKLRVVQTPDEWTDLTGDNAAWG